MDIKIFKGTTNLGFIYSLEFNDSIKYKLDIYLIFIQICIKYIRKSKNNKIRNIYNPYKYGIILLNDANALSRFSELYIYYKHNFKMFSMPWCYTWIYTAYQSKYDTWLVEDYRLHKLSKKIKYFNINTDITLGIDAYLHTRKNYFYYRRYRYRYDKLNQESDCKYRVCERCWRPIIFKRFNIFNYKRRCIEVEFKEDMGPKKGSWKGGVISCSFDMKPNETPQECIKRMEKEYTFR